jgi:hypothetical protein
MLTIIHGGRARLIAVAAKPGDAVSGLNQLQRRARERLALEKAYADELGIPWLLMSDAAVPLELRENLNLALGASDLPTIPQNLISDFCEGVSALLMAGEAIQAARSKVTSQLKLDSEVANGLFHYGLWRRRIPIDLRERLVLSRPAKLTDFSWARRDAEAIFGEHDHE